MGIKEQLLEKCVEFLTEISKQPPDDFYGAPPSVFYIDYGIVGKHNDVCPLAKVEETYRLSNGKTEVVKAGTTNRHEPVSRMYYKEGYAAIGYDLNAGKAYLSFVAGPRYGRKFSYPIIKVSDGFELGEPDLLWVQ